MTENKKNEVQTAVKKMSELTALLYFHLTKAMVEDFGPEAAATIEKGVKRFGLERGANIARKVREAGQELTIENLDKFYDMPIVAGWNPQRDYDEQGRKHNVTKSCTFADVWLRKDWAEIGHIYCEVDLAIREGYSDNVRYIPEKNILKGDEFCSSTTEYKK